MSAVSGLENGFGDGENEDVPMNFAIGDVRSRRYLRRRLQIPAQFFPLPVITKVGVSTSGFG